MRQTNTPARVAVQESVNVIRHNANIDYDKAKKLIIDTQPIVAEWPLSSVELGRNKTIKVDGRHLPVTDGAYNAFLKNVLGVKPAFVKHFSEVTDEKTEVEMLKHLQLGLASKKRERMKVIGNLDTMSILNFGDSSMNYMSNESMLNIFEQVMNEFPELSLRDLYIDGNGNLTMNIRTDNVTNLGVGEDFQGGLAFRNDPFNGSIIAHNALRLICTNGMMGMKDVARLSVNMTSKGLSKLFGEVRALANSNFMDTKFSENMLRAQKTPCSVAELRFAERNFIKHSNVTDKQLPQYLDIESTQQYLAKKGVDYVKLTDKQAQNCPTGFNLWHLVNQITHFGSHNHGLDQNFSKIQGLGGHLLSRKHFDGENIVFMN